MHDPRSILITGASSGLGAALAREYAAPGIQLALGGRDSARLDAVAAECRGRGAAVSLYLGDVAARAEIAAWIAELDAARPLDLVIANAGVSGGTGSRSLNSGIEDAGKVQAIFGANVDGMRNTVDAAVVAMRRRGRGQIAIMSSLAGFRGLPGAPAYSASKAAARAYGEALRGALGGEGVRVSVICPGYIRTPMTAANDFPMPFLMDADRAARIIRRGLARNKARIAFPWPLYAIVWLLAALPPGLTDPLLARMPKKT